MAYTKMDLINMVLGWWGEVPVDQESEVPNSRIISAGINIQLPLFQSSTLDWSFLWTYYTSNTPTPSSDVTINGNAEGLQYIYSLPSDFASISEVFFSQNYSIQPPYILTSSSPLQIRYVRNDLNYAIFPPHFMDYFSLFLAVKLGASTTRDLKILQGLSMQLESSKKLASSYEAGLKPVNDLNRRNIFINLPTNVA